MHRTVNGAARLTAVDLFCGCGGLTLGLKRAGFLVLGAVDNDPLCIETYRANHPEVSVWEVDIRKLSVAAVMRALGLRKGMLDLLAGCPPCQGFSTIRTRNGSRRVEDPRNDLLFEFQRFVKKLRPKLVMMENVPGLARDRRFAKFCDNLRRMGYQCSDRVLDAADYGVPQRRRRLILLAGLDGVPAFARRARYRRTVRDAIGGLLNPERTGDQLHSLPETRSSRIIDLIRRIPKNGGSRTSLSKKEQLACHRAFDGFKDVYGRMSWDRVAPTITGGCINPSKGRFLHPTADRAITLREASLLQTFPRRYRFSLREGKYRTAEMIGNALPPEFVRRHASALSGHLLGIGRHRARVRQADVPTSS